MLAFIRVVATATVTSLAGYGVSELLRTRPWNRNYHERSVVIQSLEFTLDRVVAMMEGIKAYDKSQDTENPQDSVSMTMKVFWFFKVFDTKLSREAALKALRECTTEFENAEKWFMAEENQVDFADTYQRFNQVRTELADLLEGLGTLAPSGVQEPVAPALNAE